MSVFDILMIILLILIAPVLLLIVYFIFCIPLIYLVEKINIIKLRKRIDYFFFYSITEPIIYESMLVKRDQMIKLLRDSNLGTIDRPIEDTYLYTNLINSAILDVLVFEKYEITKKFTNGITIVNKKSKKINLIDKIRNNPDLLFGVIGKITTLEMSTIREKMDESTMKENEELKKRFDKLKKFESLKIIFRKKIL